jgi:hypothetical protein
VGVFDRDFAIPNVYNSLALISRNRSDLASSRIRRRLRPFAGFRRFSISMTLEMALDRDVLGDSSEEDLVRAR